MYLFELFSDDVSSVIDDLRSEVMTYLTPLVANDVKFVSIDDIMDRLRNLRTGLIVDRGLVMRILDPNKVQMVQKVEGDRVYLDLPVDEINKKAEEDKALDAEKVTDKATAQAKKDIQAGI